MKRRNFLGAVLGAGALTVLPAVQPVATPGVFEREEIPTEISTDARTAQMYSYFRRGWLAQHAMLTYMGLDPLDPEVQDALRG